MDLVCSSIHRKSEALPTAQMGKRPCQPKHSSEEWPLISPTWKEPLIDFNNQQPLIGLTFDQSNIGGAFNLLLDNTAFDLSDL